MMLTRRQEKLFEEAINALTEAGVTVVVLGQSLIRIGQMIRELKNELLKIAIPLTEEEE